MVEIINSEIIPRSSNVNEIPGEREICAVKMPNGINVIDRTSSTFIASVSYNCSSIDSSKLSIWVNGTTRNKCSVMKNDVKNGLINVTCDRIHNNAGQHWILTIGGRSSDHPQVILNKTLTITLSPLNLNRSINVVVKMNAHLNSASISVVNCLNITNPEYLIFRCNTSDPLKNIVSTNCTYTCSNIEAGSILNSSFIRLPIPIADDNNKTFPEETFQLISFTGKYERKVFSRLNICCSL